MKMPIDHHSNQRRAEIKREAKRQRALEFLGIKWVLHPENPSKPVKGVYGRYGMKLS
jgi:coproporphyrinogen III oxidase